MSTMLMRGFVLPVAAILVGWSNLAAQPNYQFINAAPYVTATQDSVYFCEDGTFIGDFFDFTRAAHFRDAEGFFGPGPAGTKVMAASLTPDCANVVASTEVAIAADRNYQFILVGNVPEVENPDGVSTSLSFVVNDHAVVTGTPGTVDVTLVHASPDAPDVTGLVPVTSTVLALGPFKSLQPTQCAGGLTACSLIFPSILGKSVIEIHSTAALAAGDTTALTSVEVDLGALNGMSVTAVATGFLDPPAVGKVADHHGFKVIGVLADGTVVPLNPPPVDVTVEFAINMEVEITTGNFDPDNHIVVVAGSMNGWSTTADTLLPDFTDPNLYTKFIDIDSVVVAEAIAKTGAYSIFYKYVTGTTPGESPTGWESVSDRELVITGLEERDPETGRLIVTQAEIPTYNDARLEDFFSNPMVVTFEVDMRPAFYHNADSGGMPIDVQTSEATTFDMGVWANGPLSKAPGGWATWGPGNLDQIAELMLHDDGATGGDQVAGDSVYSFEVSYATGQPRVGDMKFGTDGYDNESTFEGNHKLSLPDNVAGSGRVRMIFGAMEDGLGDIGDALYDPYIARLRNGNARVVRRGGENDPADSEVVMAEIEFAVDMSVEITTGNFDPDNHFVVVAGSMNGWSTAADTLLPDFTNPNLFTKIVQIDSVNLETGPDSIYYKYVTGTTPGEAPTGWESVSDRLIRVTGFEPDADGNGYLDVVQDPIPTYNDARIEDFFANDQTVIFEVDMRPAFYHNADSGGMPIDVQTSEATTFNEGVWANGPLSKAPGGWATWGPGNLDQLDQLLLFDDGATAGDAVAGDSIYTFTVNYTAGEPRVGDMKFGTDGYDNESNFEGNHKLSLPDPAGKGQAESRVQLIFGAMEDGTGDFGDALYNPYICRSYGGPDIVVPIVVRSGGDSGCDTAVAVEPVGTEIPTEIALGDNYPNPFNPTTTFEYNITTAGPVQVNIYDLSGRLVDTLVDEVQSAARYKVTFDSKNLASGVYIYQLRTADRVMSKKMLLLK